MTDHFPCSRAARFVGALALGVAMVLPGAIASPAFAGDAGASSGFQHYLDCMGELLSPQHQQDCGSSPNSQGDPMGLSHTGTGGQNCAPIAPVSLRLPLLPSDMPLASALDNGQLQLATFSTGCAIPCVTDYHPALVVDSPIMASRTEDDAGPMLVPSGTLVACVL